jgi:hypothetical protein
MQNEFFWFASNLTKRKSYYMLIKENQHKWYCRSNNIACIALLPLRKWADGIVYCRRPLKVLCITQSDYGKTDGIQQSKQDRNI